MRMSRCARTGGTSSSAWCATSCAPRWHVERLTESPGGPLRYQFRRAWHDGSTALAVGSAGVARTLGRPGAATAAPVAGVSRGPRPAGPLASGHRADAVPGRRAAGGAGLAPLALGAAPAPGVCARGPGLSALRRPAADPRGGDRAPRGPAAARRAGAGRYAAAPRCRHRPVTRRRSQRPRGRGSPALPAARPGVSATSSGVRPAPAARAARALAGPTRGALDSGHPADAPARLPAALGGKAGNGLWTA